MGRRLRQLARQRDAEALCIADSHVYGWHPGWAERQLAEFLQAYFPTPAPWEVPGA